MSADKRKFYYQIATGLFKDIYGKSYTDFLCAVGIHKGEAAAEAEEAEEEEEEEVDQATSLGELFPEDPRVDCFSLEYDGVSVMPYLNSGTTATTSTPSMDQLDDVDLTGVEMPGDDARFEGGKLCGYFSSTRQRREAFLAYARVVCLSYLNVEKYSCESRMSPEEFATLDTNTIELLRGYQLFDRYRIQWLSRCYVNGVQSLSDVIHLMQDIGVETLGGAGGFLHSREDLVQNDPQEQLVLQEARAFVLFSRLCKAVRYSCEPGNGQYGCADCRVTGKKGPSSGTLVGDEPGTKESKSRGNGDEERMVLVRLGMERFPDGDTPKNSAEGVAGPPAGPLELDEVQVPLKKSVEPFFVALFYLMNLPLVICTSLRAYHEQTASSAGAENPGTLSPGILVNNFLESMGVNLYGGVLVHVRFLEECIRPQAVTRGDGSRVQASSSVRSWRLLRGHIPSMEAGVSEQTARILGWHLFTSLYALNDPRAHPTMNRRARLSSRGQDDSSDATDSAVCESSGVATSNKFARSYGTEEIRLAASELKMNCLSDEDLKLFDRLLDGAGKVDESGLAPLLFLFLDEPGSSGQLSASPSVQQCTDTGGDLEEEQEEQEEEEQEEEVGADNDEIPEEEEEEEVAADEVDDDDDDDEMQDVVPEAEEPLAEDEDGNDAEEEEEEEKEEEKEEAEELAESRHRRRRRHRHRSHDSEGDKERSRKHRRHKHRDRPSDGGSDRRKHRQKHHGRHRDRDKTEEDDDRHRKVGRKHHKDGDVPETTVRPRKRVCLPL